MLYIIPKNLREEFKIFDKPKIYWKDVVTLAVLMILFLMFAAVVHTWLVAPYWVFSALSALYLICPAKRNPKRRNWEAMLYLISKNYATYYSLDRSSAPTKREGMS